MTAVLSRRSFIIGLGAFVLVRCGGRDDAAPTPASAHTVATLIPTATATSPAAPSPTPLLPTAAPAGPVNVPLGLPLDPAIRLGLVTGAVGSRTLAWGEGPQARDYSRDDQPSDDPVRANRSGWNARTHVEYEGQPAVDWYIPVGTPIVATMDGTATLLVNTVSNPFDVYGVSREPYIGNPDRARAPISPFPGPGGGQGAFVRIESDTFRTDNAHFDLAATVRALPANAWLAGFSASMDLATTFGPLLDFRIATALARWDVQRGQVIGFSGDSGYSEAPHLHYTIKRLGAANNLCPTAEPGFDDNNWLFR